MNPQLEPNPGGSGASPRHVVLLGATGTIGRAVLAELMRAGHRVTCLGRQAPTGAHFMACGFDHPETVKAALARLAPVDAIVSCLASRTGAPRDAWAIDHDAHLQVLRAAQQTGVRQFVLLSAICVQKPRLAFQQAKLAFERELIGSGLDYSIVRATAFFKSLTGQVERVRSGKSFLVFADGHLTACKPISDRDLAVFIVQCLQDPARSNRILPIGGPGPAISPLQQAEHLFEQLGRPLKVRSVPLGLLDAVIAVCSALGRIWPRMADKAEFARIGRYYATESMLLWDEARQCYDAASTPEFGQDTLLDFQARLLRGEVSAERGDHAVF